MTRVKYAMRKRVFRITEILIGLMVLLIILAQEAVCQGIKHNDSVKVVHVFVALCDNVNQGILPVSSELGNGQVPRTNLYWGARYGMKTFTASAEGWHLLNMEKNPSNGILERCIFVSDDSGVIIVADAYDGSKIRQAIEDFLSSAAGSRFDTVVIDGRNIHCGGKAQLLAYAGHDGLMDFTLDDYPHRQDSVCREVVILACYSKRFFAEAVDSAGACPLLWTTGLMAPEAYTLLAAVESWAADQSDDTIREEAAEAYSHNQKCSLTAARGLFVTGR